MRDDINSNSVEGFFQIVKRGLNGIYHSMGKKHVYRYMSEYEFRYNHRDLEDAERTTAAIKGAERKRLMYKEPITNKA